MPATATPVISIVRDDPTDEPLLSAVKRLLSIDFSAHDLRLMDCINAAKRQVERATGYLLDSATVTVSWKAFYDWEQLPWGPVTGTVTSTTLAGASLETGEMSGDFPTLFGDFATGIKLVYRAGYETPDQRLPELSECAANLAANLFDGGNRNWQAMASQISRYTWAS